MRGMASKALRKVMRLPRRAKHARHARRQAALASVDARILELEGRFGALERASAAFALTGRMRAALFASIGLRLFLIFGVGLQMAQKPKADKTDHSLEVVLVNAKSPTRPVVADALAQHNLDGGGNVSEKRRAQSPLPALDSQKAEAEVKLALKRVEQLEREARQVMTQPKSKAEVQSAPPKKPAPEVVAESRSDLSASDLMQRSVEIARLDAKISRDWDAYQERPRRRFIGSRTQEMRFARYIDDWRQKIERVGDLNYPQGARDQRIRGRLVVTVAIKSDGTVEQVDINVPSGHKILDDAARRIVQLAAPFSPFPPNIAKDVDVLHITRTWTFTAADRFISE
jgi:protein TonB